MLKITNLHAYQRTTVEHIIDNSRAGVFLEMGLGKTVSTLTAFETLKDVLEEVSTALVVSTKRITEGVWAQECQKWEHLRKLRVSIIAGSEKQRRKALMQKVDIYCISVDNIAWLCGLYGGSRLPFDMLILDELSCFKNPKAVRFKALRQCAPSFKRVVGLTGTPAPNGLIDLWAQMYLIDMGERLGKFISGYRTEYFREGRKKGHVVYNYVLEKDSEERIFDKISDICISMKTREHLELPKRTDHIITVVMSDEEREKYIAFEREKVLEVVKDSEDGEIAAVEAGALTMKLLQYANGFVYDEDKVAHDMHERKLDELERIVEEAQGQSVLVARNFTYDIEMIKKRLKRFNPRELKSQKDFEDWNAGLIQVGIAHPKSAGHGLNLQDGGHIVVWYGLTRALEEFLQYNARLDRQGQKWPVQVYQLVTEGTVDEDIIEARKAKIDTQEALMSAVKARIKKYLQ